MATTTATPAPKVERLRLRHPEFEGLVFGDGPDAIKFGIRGGFAPGRADVAEDHPLLPALLEKHPGIEILRDNEPVKVWMCPVHTESTFRTRSALMSHLRSGDHDEMFASLVAGGDEAQGGGNGPSGTGGQSSDQAGSQGAQDGQGAGGA